MNKRGGIIFSILFIIILALAMFSYAFYKNYSYSEICRDMGYEKTIGWNSEPIKFFVMLGQPNRSYVDCVRGEEYKKFFLDEVNQALSK